MDDSRPMAVLLHVGNHASVEMLCGLGNLPLVKGPGMSNLCVEPQPKPVFDI